MAVEIENVYIAKLANPRDLLKSNSRTRIEQWEICSGQEAKNPGVVRVRSYDRKDYELTTKVFNGAKTGSVEINTVIEKNMFDAVKELAPIGTVKYRFKFPAGNGLFWEFDCVKDEEGNFKPWVKIDLELRNANTTVPDFPVELAEVIVVREAGNKMELTADQEKRLEKVGKQFAISNKNHMLPIKDYM